MLPLLLLAAATYRTVGGQSARLCLACVCSGDEIGTRSQYQSVKFLIMVHRDSQLDSMCVCPPADIAESLVPLSVIVASGLQPFGSKHSSKGGTQPVRLMLGVAVRDGQLLNHKVKNADFRF